MSQKVKITIDGREYEVEAGENVLQICLDRGLLIPHFCYHEALGPVGACRLCAASIAPAADKPGRLDMTCMTRATDGMVININDDYARAFRKKVIEDLMLNHPHDCPVCDEGGECMLQNMTVLSEHQHRTTRFPKRTWVNQYLGPFIHHEMNRCITCYRCTRFYGEYALGRDLGAFGSRDRVYFGRVRDGVLESEFSGNLVDVCPTGVFTDKRFREVYARPWDLSTARSVCVHCSVGCTVLPGFRHGTLRRVKPAENPVVNKFFICDRGRFGGEFVNHSLRLRAGRVDGTEMAAEEAADAVLERLKTVVAEHGPDAVAAFGSARASLESNGALGILMAALGSRNVAFFASDAERAAARRAAAITVSGQVRIASLPEMEKADCVFIAGGDLTAEAAMMDLSVRQAIRAGAPVFIVSPRAGSLDRYARMTLRTRPGAEAAVLAQIADTNAPVGGEAQGFVAAARETLAVAKKPLLLASAMRGDGALVETAFAFVQRLSSGERTCSLAYWFAGPNTAGVALTREDVPPSIIWDGIRDNRIKALVVLEHDLAQAFATDSEFTAALKNLRFLVVLDSVQTATSLAANAIVPCVSHYQSSGTFMNYEGRCQRFAGLPIPGPVARTSSEMLIRMIEALGQGDLLAAAEYSTVYDITADSSMELDALEPDHVGIRVRLASHLQPPAVAAAAAPATPAPLQFALWKTHLLFGSEPLSALAPPIAELTPKPWIEMHPEDARHRRLKEGATADFTRELGVSGPLKLNENLARHVVAVPALAVPSGAPVREEVMA
jgi:NADH-quinone oxidoreductase subunit G